MSKYWSLLSELSAGPEGEFGLALLKTIEGVSVNGRYDIAREHTSADAINKLSEAHEIGTAVRHARGKKVRKRKRLTTKVERSCQVNRIIGLGVRFS